MEWRGEVKSWGKRECCFEEEGGFGIRIRLFGGKGSCGGNDYIGCLKVHKGCITT